MRAFIFASLVIITRINCQQGSQYLQNAVRDLKKLSTRQVLKRADTVMLSSSIPKVDVPISTSLARIQQGNEVPPLSLTKSELTALYQSAVAKGETLKIDTGDNEFIHTAVHGLDNSGSQSHDIVGGDTGNTDAIGYYYYYYPIKTFVDEFSSQPSSTTTVQQSKPKLPKRVTTEKPSYQFHSHHHEHNITINKNMTEGEKNSKGIEPLFMAISGFIGMAVMFVLSVLFIPKFGTKPNKTKLFGINKNDDIDDFARLAMNAIDNGDCAERFACELSKTARAFNLQDNRFVKLFKRIVPRTFGKHFEKVEKYRNKHLMCTSIPCKKKANNNKPGQKKKNVTPKKH